jgi:hypothetical protein
MNHRPPHNAFGLCIFNQSRIQPEFQLISQT